MQELLNVRNVVANAHKHYRHVCIALPLPLLSSTSCYIARLLQGKAQHGSDSWTKHHSPWSDWSLKLLPEPKPKHDCAILEGFEWIVLGGF